MASVFAALRTMIPSHGMKALGPIWPQALYATVFSQSLLFIFYYALMGFGLPIKYRH